MPYQRILETLLAGVAGARAALLLDSQGELVVGAGELGERERLVGAYSGITLGMALRERGAQPRRAESTTSCGATSTAAS